MSVSSQETVFHHVGNGVTVTFAFNCQVPTATDLVVYVNDVLTTTGFTIAGIGSLSGGSITFAVAPANLVAVRIERDIELERTTDYQQNGDFLSRVVNPDFDRLWMALQQHFAGIRRALKVPKSDATAPGDLPSIADRADKLLSFDAAGNPISVFPAAGTATALQALLALFSGSTLIGSIQDGIGAILQTVQDKLRELRRSVKGFGAVGNGIANDTASFTLARAATGGHYHIPNGVYVVDAVPDVLADGFTTGDAVTLIIAGTPRVIPNGISGGLYLRRASNVKLDLVDVVTGNVVMYWQNGAPGTATGWYRGLAVTSDSHWMQVQPATNGGSCDLLWQRSPLNADPGGNRFNQTFEENNDRLLFNYATTASGAPVFDSAMIMYAGLVPALDFPGVRPRFQQGFTVQTRAGGALKLSLVPGATVHTMTDETSGNATAYYNRSSVKIGGITFNTLFDVPPITEGPQRWGGNFGDLLTALPVAKTLFTLTGGTRYGVIGTLRVAAAPSGAAGTWRETRFTHDGTTLTLTDLVNTLPAQITATIAMSGADIQFQASYAGGLGGGVAVSASVEWSHVGR